jgi:hypothetical protein
MNRVPSDRRFEERALIREAVAKSSATENVGRELTEEVIAASRAVVEAWHSTRRLGWAIAELEKLVGRPSGKARPAMKSNHTLYCWFCRKDQNEVEMLIAGPDAFICGECVERCMKILVEQRRKIREASDEK